MFVGLYAAKYIGVLAKDTPKPQNDGVDFAESCDIYDLQLDERLADLRGKVFIDWGDGTRAWVQRADNQNKPVIEVRPEFKEPEFPGYLNFTAPLSNVERLPKTWIENLKYAKGVYLLTCPKTKEQYVGSASGEEGFWHRWIEYVTTGHGGNVALKSREYSDYQVSILEVAGSASNVDDILKMESRWKEKLQSREMGLNRN
jgi:GIY-YIG catalytic domain